jgi:hypothetical protein
MANQKKMTKKNGFQAVDHFTVSTTDNAVINATFSGGNLKIGKNGHIRHQISLLLHYNSYYLLVTIYHVYK